MCIYGKKYVLTLNAKIIFRSHPIHIPEAMGFCFLNTFLIMPAFNKTQMIPIFPNKGKAFIHK